MPSSQGTARRHRLPPALSRVPAAVCGGGGQLPRPGDQLGQTQARGQSRRLASNGDRRTPTAGVFEGDDSLGVRTVGVSGGDGQTNSRRLVCRTETKRRTPTAGAIDGDIKRGVRRVGEFRLAVGGNSAHGCCQVSKSLSYAVSLFCMLGVISINVKKYVTLLLARRLVGCFQMSILRYCIFTLPTFCETLQYHCLFSA